MKQNLFNQHAKDEILRRSHSLTSDSIPLWGSMTAPEMLRHCSEVLKATLAHPQHPKSSSPKQVFIRYLMLYVLPRYPKGAKAPRRLDMKFNNVKGLHIEDEKKYFAEKVNFFNAYTGDINTHHPYFGNMSHKQWGIITWMHLDHHLRQFGV